MRSRQYTFDAQANPSVQGYVPAGLPPSLFSFGVGGLAIHMDTRAPTLTDATTVDRVTPRVREILGRRNALGGTPIGLGRACRNSADGGTLSPPQGAENGAIVLFDADSEIATCARCGDGERFGQPLAHGDE